MITSKHSVHLDALSYDAPFLIEKLQKERIVDTAKDGLLLFDEVKKYLILVHTDRSVAWKMFSLRIDEVWHQFVLFTREYVDFCDRFFGTYLHHMPSNAPQNENIPEKAPLSFRDFKVRYENFFGEPISSLWFDARNVSLSRRIVNYNVGLMTSHEENGIINVFNRANEVQFSINEIARDAIEFIMSTGAFYVRELPGNLTNEEKVALISTFVDYSLLRMAG